MPGSGGAAAPCRRMKSSASISTTASMDDVFQQVTKSHSEGGDGKAAAGQGCALGFASCARAALPADDPSAQDIVAGDHGLHSRLATPARADEEDDDDHPPIPADDGGAPQPVPRSLAVLGRCALGLMPCARVAKAAGDAGGAADRLRSAPPADFGEDGFAYVCGPL
mmetsp:Transcript_109624/g.306540  ORF Transcript_109624/g.306540 Transcript_109624/m.306540 type:complete len:167 (+) Transcript_109624:2-502(+)